jgi:signal transduction histidine kinase
VKPSLRTRIEHVTAPRTVAGAVARFALTGLLVLLVVGVGGVEVLRRAGRTEAVRDAREVAGLVGEGIVAPAITPGVLRGDAAAIAAFDEIVARRVLRSPVVRVKLWDASGRIVYSDEHRLIGARYPIRADELRSLRSGRSDAEISDLARPENRFERGHGKLMEVYLGIRAPDGTRLLFETYQRYSAVASSGRDRWLTFLPVLIGALGLLALLQVPLALSLARRVRRAERATLERTLDIQQAERRRIASDLHDGVVQTLAGISYRLGAAAGHVRDDTPAPLADGVRESARETRESMRALRSLLVDIYPPSLQREGLVAALSDLSTRTGGSGLRVELDAPDDLHLPAQTEALLFRAAQEGLRNVVTHARAERAAVTLERNNGHVQLDVHDDGRGFSDDQLARAGMGGHFGLRALEDLVRDHGGEMSVTSRPGLGTRLTVKVPLR